MQVLMQKTHFLAFAHCEWWWRKRLHCVARLSRADLVFFLKLFDRPAVLIAGPDLRRRIVGP